MARFNEVVDEVVALCGNRRDNRGLFESAVNQAILALWNRHVGYTVGVVVLDIGQADTRLTVSPLNTNQNAFVASINVSRNLESVEGVSYTYDGDRYTELVFVRPKELLVGVPAVEQSPRVWTVANDGIVYVRPAFTRTPLAWRILGVRKPTYLRGDEEITVLPDSMRASYVALATSIAKTYLGEGEMAQSLGVLSAMLGPREVGPSGKSGTASDLGVRPLVEV